MPAPQIRAHGYPSAVRLDTLHPEHVEPSNAAPLGTGAATGSPPADY
jgi:hypothetical protein